MGRLVLGIVVASMPVAVAAQWEPNTAQPLLWDKVRAGMSTSELRQYYPEKGGKVKWHGSKQTEVEDIVILEGCEAEVEIQHEAGTVDAVKVKGRGSIGGRCSDKVLGALSAKYGQPLVERDRKQSILAREGEITVWNKGGVTLRFKQFTSGVFGGAGLGQSSWELT